MFRLLIALFWVSLIIGTLLAHSVVANWAVTLAACTSPPVVGRSPTSCCDFAPLPRSTPPVPDGAGPTAAASIASLAPVRSRWTVDRVHSAERRWR